MLKVALNNNLLLLLLLSFFWACNSQSGGEKWLDQAAEVYQEALAIEKETRLMLDELVQRRNSLSVQGRVLTKEEQTFIEAVYALEKSHEEWKMAHEAVPGLSEPHHGRHHQEDHHSKPGISPEKMLSVQKELRDSIRSIQQSVKKLL